MTPAHSRIYNIICEHPGIKLCEIRKITGDVYTTVWRRVMSLDRYGLLASEDEAGRLYPFRVVDEQDAIELRRQIGYIYTKKAR